MINAGFRRIGNKELEAPGPLRTFSVYTATPIRILFGRSSKSGVARDRFLWFHRCYRFDVDCSACSHASDFGTSRNTGNPFSRLRKCSIIVKQEALADIYIYIFEILSTLTRLRRSSLKPT